MLLVALYQLHIKRPYSMSLDLSSKHNISSPWTDSFLTHHHQARVWIHNPSRFSSKLIVSIIFPWTDLFLTDCIMTSRVTGITTKVREFTDLRYKTFFLLWSSIDWVRDLAPSTIEREVSFVGLGISWIRRLQISSTRRLWFVRFY